MADLEVLDKGKGDRKVEKSKSRRVEESKSQRVEESKGRKKLI